MSKVIELTNVVDTPRTRSWKMSGMIVLMKIIACLLIAVLFSHGMQIAIAMAKDAYGDVRHWVLSQITRVEVVRQYVTPTNATIDELIERAARETGVSADILHTIVDAESAGGRHDQLYRFEPKVFTRLQASRKCRDDAECRVMASSWGPMQVMGYNAQPRCGIHWSKLLDPGPGILCGAKIMRQNLDNVRHLKDPATRLRAAFVSYNGAESYGDRAMFRFTQRMFSRLKIHLS